MDWQLSCAACGAVASPQGLQTICACGQPWLVRYPERRWSALRPADLGPEHGMWRYRPFLPLLPGETPVSLGEGGTPLLPLSRGAAEFGMTTLWLKDEGVNPTGSFKARGLSAAITRAQAADAAQFVLPTAGNAGIAASAYAARAGVAVRIYAPETTPPTILAQIRWFGGDLQLLPGHIGDCGKASRQFAAERGAVDLSTLREPYRIEGKKTLGFEIAEQLGWTLPDAILYPTGGGTGLIGMWKAFQELADAGWVKRPLPRMYSVQAAGCAPIVRAFEAGRTSAEAWTDPKTVASGLRVPGPLGDRLILSAVRESGGSAVAIPDGELSADATRFSRLEGLDLSPEGGATFSALRHLLAAGSIQQSERVVLFNTGAGWLYR
ncbi:MAG: threonine synthase [Gemmatimonadales bacterium]